MDPVLFEMPVTSNTLIPGGPIFSIGFAQTSILCDYEDPVSGRPFRLTLIFEGIEETKLTYRYSIDVEKIENAYEQVVDVGETEWLRRVTSTLIAHRADASNLRHLLIYFDGGPGIEFICRTFRTTTESINS